MMILFETNSVWYTVHFVSSLQVLRIAFILFMSWEIRNLFRPPREPDLGYRLALQVLDVQPSPFCYSPQNTANGWIKPWSVVTGTSVNCIQSRKLQLSHVIGVRNLCTHFPRKPTGQCCLTISISIHSNNKSTSCIWTSVTSDFAHECIVSDINLELWVSMSETSKPYRLEQYKTLRPISDKLIWLL